TACMKKPIGKLIATTPNDTAYKYRTKSQNSFRVTRPLKLKRRLVQFVGTGPSLPQELVDRRLCARLLIHLLHDHRAIERGPARRAWQAARHDDGVGRHAAIKNLTALAVHDLGRGAKEHAHGKYRAFADDHAFGHFRPRADEAIVLDDHGVRLQRL